MEYISTLIKKGQFTPTFWSGGMATELTTYPEGSSYAARDFFWRLGFAKIDIMESTFSNLPGISRTLMVTNGRLNLTHEGKYSKSLGIFEQDSFNGEWKTTTKGKCSVFNLMTQKNYFGEVFHVRVNPNASKTFTYCASYEKEIVSICFFSVSGVLKTKISHNTSIVKSDELLILNPITSVNNHKFVLSNGSSEILDIIVSAVYRK